MALIALIIVSSVIGAIGVRSVVGLTGITLASNLGTFVLYGLTCVWTIVAFRKRADHNLLLHDIIPGLGVLANLVMLIAIVYLYAIGNADSKNEAYIMFVIAGGWLIRVSPSPAASPSAKTDLPAVPAGMGNSPASEAPTPARLKEMADTKAAPLLDKLKADPGNPDLLAGIGNLYYDAQQ